MADVYYVVRENNSGLCTVSKGIGAQPGWTQCSGPYSTKEKASDWIAKNCDDAGICSKDKCDRKP